MKNSIVVNFQTRRRSSAHRIRLVMCGVVLVVAGCGFPKADLFDPAAIRPSESPSAYDDQPWADVLRTSVRDGLIDYELLKQSPQQLDQYTDHIAFVGPVSTPAFFPDRSSRLAYAINSYNACVLRAVLAAGIPSTMHDVAMRNLEFDYRFRVDGRIVNLAQIRKMAEKESAGDARMYFALCSGAKGAPPLGDQPYRAKGIKDRLDELARQSIANPRMVFVDHEKQKLLVALEIWSNREAFYELFRRETRNTTATMLNCLMHLAESQRRQFLARAVGYKVSLLPFDRALNSWSPQTGG